MAMFLLAITIAILARTFPLASAAGRKSDRLTTATFLGQALVEELLIRDPALWPSTGRFDPPYEPFEYRVDKESWARSPQLNIMRIKIVHEGRETFVLETLVHR